MKITRPNALHVALAGILAALACLATGGAHAAVSDGSDTFSFNPAAVPGWCNRNPSAPQCGKAVAAPKQKSADDGTACARNAGIPACKSSGHTVKSGR